MPLRFRLRARPLLRGDDPLAILQALAEKRDPIYGEADIIVDSVEAPHSTTVLAIIDALEAQRP